MSDSDNSSLHAMQQQAQATFLPFGPGDVGDGGAVPQIVETYGHFEAEYAAIGWNFCIACLPTTHARYGPARSGEPSLWDAMGALSRT
jgi:hypothetical protein